MNTALAPFETVYIVHLKLTRFVKLQRTGKPQ